MIQRPIADGSLNHLLQVIHCWESAHGRAAVHPPLRKRSVRIVWQVLHAAQPPPILTEHFLGEDRWLSTVQVDGIFEHAGIDAKHWEGLLQLLLWYGVLGVVRENEEEAFIYDVKYDLKRLLAIARITQEDGRLLAMNPALWSGLELKATD